MSNFLSNDRKVILASTITGMTLLAILTFFFLTNKNSEMLMGLSCMGAVLVYWNVPTWFNRKRQPKFIRGKYFNAENEEIPLRSNRHEFICLFLMLSINGYLFFFGYDILWKYLNNTFPSHEFAWANIFTFLTVSLPYIMRHAYCFFFNRPMDTSAQIDWVNRPSSFNCNDRRTQNYISNPSYSYLSYNVHHRTHR